jgi:hypothetical protein
MKFDADTTRFLRVVANSDNEAAIAGANSKSVGVCWMNDVDVSESDRGSVRLHAAGTTVMVASGAISAGAPVYGAAAGKVTATTGGALEGVALTAAGADGDYIEVLPIGAETMRHILHTVTAGEDTANIATIDTGLGVVLSFALVETRTSAGVIRAGNTVTFGSGGDAGKITVANSNLAATDVITIYAATNPVTI